MWILLARLITSVTQYERSLFFLLHSHITINECSDLLIKDTVREAVEAYTAVTALTILILCDSIRGVKVA